MFKALPKYYQSFIGKVVRHYRGNYYYVENICTDSDTLEYVVVYRTLYENKISNNWVRKASDFFCKIDKESSKNITGQVYRFELVDDLATNYDAKHK